METFNSLPRVSVTELSNRPVIKFSTLFDKLHGQRSGLLASAEFIRIDENTPPAFVEHETAVAGQPQTLKFGQYIQLVFIGDMFIPFSTLRPLRGKYGDLMPYYKKNIGAIFEFQILKP